MPKQAEIAYAANMQRVLNVPAAEVEHHFMHKPYGDPRRAAYLLDIAQLLALLPPPPARVLELGAGSGWTAEFLAKCGYEVLGLDIAEDLIAFARRRGSSAGRLAFEVWDYEVPFDFGRFDAVVIYDALHHAENEAALVANAYLALREGGVLVTMEPGAGHSKSPDTLDAVAKYGTTEKDMPCSYQTELMRAAGFSSVGQYLRLSLLPLEDVSTGAGRFQQDTQYLLLRQSTEAGQSSVVVAVKAATGPVPAGDASLAWRLAHGARVLYRGVRQSVRVAYRAFRGRAT